MLARIRKTEVEAQGRYRKLWLERHTLWYSLLYRQAIVRFIAKFNSEEYADPPKRKTMYAPLFLHIVLGLSRLDAMQRSIAGDAAKSV